MKIRYKSSIGIFLIFTINLMLLLLFCKLSLKPDMNETIIRTLKADVTGKIYSTISSDKEADALIAEIDKSIDKHEYKISIANKIIKKILLFEGFVFFILLLLLSIALYYHFVRPIESLTKSMEDFGRGINPQKGTIRKDEIGSLENQFIELTQSLESEKYKQNHIIASISHDIKTPLTVIMGYAERILKKDFSKEQEKSYLQTIYTKSQNINEILNEFDEYLNYNFEGSLTLKEYKVSDLANMIKEEYADELSDIGVNFSIVNNCNISCLSVDLIKFKRVIGNLVGNSLKHMRENPTIILTIHFDRKYIIFTLTDNGSGVNNRDLPYIFEPFYTSDQSRKVAGLGLSICKNIVTAHKGKISAINKTDEGFQVDVFLPFQPS